MKPQRSGDGEDAITFVITSCGRFDLLEECLASFLQHNTAPITRYVLVEDSGDHRVHEVVAKFVARFDAPIEVMVNDPPLGQIAAIDRAYQTVTTPYIFHCEDDWRFFRSGFIEESLLVLKHDAAATAVLSRRPGQHVGVDEALAQQPLISASHVQYRRSRMWAAREWHGYSFNPGLRRLSDYRQLGDFSRWGHEADSSLYFKLRGRGLAYLAEPASETTGMDSRLPKLAPHLSPRSRRQHVRAKWRFRLAQLWQRRPIFGRDP